MNASMATRNVAGVKVETKNTTEYVMHKSQTSLFNGIQHKVIDYSEHRLMRYIDSVTDRQQKLVLMALLSDYISGQVAIAWREGRPTYIRVTSET